MLKSINSFDNLVLGPLISIDGSKTDAQYLDEFLSEGIIPIRIITDRKNPIFKQVLKEHSSNLKIKTVIITVQYREAYE